MVRCRGVRAFFSPVRAVCLLFFPTFFLISAHLFGVLDLAGEDQFAWPPGVFAPPFPAMAPPLGYAEYVSSLIQSLEEWRQSPHTANGTVVGGSEIFPAAYRMVEIVKQISTLRRHARYLKEVTKAVMANQPPRICAVNLTSPNGEPEPLHLHLLILVKSPLSHFAQRDAVRSTWGQRRPWSSHAVIFLVGLEPESRLAADHQAALQREHNQQGDVLQCGFIDTRNNGTEKVMCGLHYVVDVCPVVGNPDGFLFLTDDEAIVNKDNLKKLLEEIKSRQTPEDGDVYLGYRPASLQPDRRLLSPRRVSRSQYPFDWYPPYIAEAGILLSKSTTDKLYFASHFVPFFPLHDVYLGMLAHMIGISSQKHNQAFAFDLASDTVDLYFSTLISLHSFRDAHFMIDTYDRLQLLT